MTKMPEGKLDIVPAVSVRNGEVVVVRGDRYERLEDEDGKPLDPAVFIEQVLKQYPRALVVDLNGIEDNRPQMEMLQEVAELGEIWVDPGARYADNIIDIFVAGVSAVVLGTKTIDGVDQLRAAFEMSEAIYFSIDWNGKLVSHSEEMKHMSPSSLADIARNIGIGKLIFTDLSRREGGKPLEAGLIKSLAGGPTPLYVDGGVVEADLDTIRELGASGAMLSVLSMVTEAK